MTITTIVFDLDDTLVPERAFWDAAFDAGLVSFTDEGRAIWKPSIDPAALGLLQPDTGRLRLVTPKHREQLAWHRRHFAFD